MASGSTLRVDTPFINEATITAHSATIHELNTDYDFNTVVAVMKNTGIIDVSNQSQLFIGVSGSRGPTLKTSDLGAIVGSSSTPSSSWAIKGQIRSLLITPMRTFPWAELLSGTCSDAIMAVRFRSLPRRSLR